MGANGEYNNIDVLRMILKLMGRDANDFDHVNDRPGGDKRYAIDATKLQTSSVGHQSTPTRGRSGRDHRLVPRARKLVDAG